MADLRGFVAQRSVGVAADGTRVGLKATRRGELIVMDFFTQMAIEQRVFQVRAGTITAPLVGAVTIGATGAEACADAALGLTLIPCQMNMSVRLGGGTLHEYALKSTPTASTAGTAFVPLNLCIGGRPPASTARVQAAGSVTVTSEVATATLRHWTHSNPLAVAAGDEPLAFDWAPIYPPTLVGPACFYLQVAATTTGPSYYASFDYVELPTGNVT